MVKLDRALLVLAFDRVSGLALLVLAFDRGSGLALLVLAFDRESVLAHRVSVSLGVSV